MRANPCTFSSELIRLDLPTFDRPRKAISGSGSRGQSASAKALLMNSALVVFITTGFRHVGIRQTDQETRLIVPENATHVGEQFWFDLRCNHINAVPGGENHLYQKADRCLRDCLSPVLTYDPFRVGNN